MTDHAIKLSPNAVYYHITHWKAGSQWLLAVLKDAFGAAVVQPQDLVKHAYVTAPTGGSVYPCCYLTQPEFSAIPSHPGARRFVLIRDLRDTLVSGYFSLRYTHSLMGQIEKYRWFLNRWSMEDGLIYLMDVWLLQSALIQRSWLASGERVFTLEDFMEQPAESLHRALSQAWGLEVPRGAAEKLAERHAFARYSGGRVPGQEDTKSHYRKGVHGDWRQHFTPGVRERFKTLYNDIMLASGYETKPDWA
jgi:lipopolysaccharide transport system ATP-binding protein